MNTLQKPKHMAEKLNIRAVDVTRFAKQIEESQLHKFEKTPLGSFLFEEEELKLLKEYMQLIEFMGNKENALEMLAFRMEKVKEKEKNYKPNWFIYLKNAYYR